jgi:hypothetical protein
VGKLEQSKEEEVKVDEGGQEFYICCQRMEKKRKKRITATSKGPKVSSSSKPSRTTQLQSIMILPMAMEPDG